MDTSIFLRNRLWNLTEEIEYNHKERFNYRIKIIDNILIDKTYGRVLEIGCGYGRFLNKFKSIDRITSIVGIDISMTELVSAYKKGFGVIRANGEKLPFKDESFDVVTSANGSPKEMDMNKLLSEVYRVLKKGGIFAFDTYNKYPLEKIAKYKIMRFLRINNKSFTGINGGIEDIEEFKITCFKSGFEIMAFYTIFPILFFPYGILLKGSILSRINMHLIGILEKRYNGHFSR